MTKKQEVLAFLMTCIPLIIGILPFFTQSYGMAGYWCSITFFEPYSSNADILWFVSSYGVVLLIFIYNFMNMFTTIKFLQRQK